MQMIKQVVKFKSLFDLIIAVYLAIIVSYHPQFISWI